MTRTIAALCAGLVVCALSPAEAKPESPSKALKRGVKKLQKLKSYRVTANVRGGQAEGPKHNVPSPKVNQTFECTVKGKVAEIDKKAFRWRFRGADGAIKSGSNWKSLLATDEGRLIGRLFLRPEEHLANALKYRKKAAWVAGKLAPKAKAQAGGGLQFEEEGDAKDKKDAGTRTRKAKTTTKSKAKAQEITSNVVHVEAPASLAVEQFNTIVGSGCFSEG